MELTKAVYPLSEAAEILRCANGHLLELAAEADVGLHIRVTANVGMYNVGWSDVQLKSKPDERMGRPQPVGVTGIDFLRLYPQDCKHVLSAGLALVREFPAGGGLNRDGILHCREPVCPPHYAGSLAEYKGIDKVYRRLAPYPHGTDPSDWVAMMYPVPIEVTPDMLLITREAISELKGQLDSAQTQVLGKVMLEVKPHTTQRLRDLCELHGLLFGCAHLPNFVTPTQDSIAARLVDQYKFTKNQASCGAWILSETTVDADLKTGAKRLHATLLKTLVRCSDVHWSASSTCPNPNPSNTQVAEWLKNCEFPIFRGEVAASLIRPSSAPKGRKPKADG